MRTTYAVWEITLKCNLACIHCGSRAGEARADELSTAEALDTVRQLAEVGIKEVTLIGGEAYLRPDWLEIAAATVRAGMRCTVTTGGYAISPATARRMKEAGIEQVSVSVDGLEKTHDFLRGRPGSWQQCFATLDALRTSGMPVTANTQINRLSAPELFALHDALREAGSRAWQFQLTVPMGNAADHADLLLQPCELLAFYPIFAKLVRKARAEGIAVYPGNNIGYYGPYERLFRGGEHSIWMGCQAGLASIGLEADGTVKACPSLPTATYTAGNLREKSLRDILAESEKMAINLSAGKPEGTNHLWGFCATCEFAELCRGGCHWTAHVFFGRRGNNPYCHHRALTQAARGIRERVELIEYAPGEPFDNGLFCLIEEPLAAPWPENDLLHFAP